MMVEMTLPEDSPYAGRRCGSVPFPANTVLTGIIRGGRVITRRDDALEPGDELLFVTTPGGRGGAELGASTPQPRAEAQAGHRERTNDDER